MVALLIHNRHHLFPVSGKIPFGRFCKMISDLWYKPVLFYFITKTITQH